MRSLLSNIYYSRVLRNWFSLLLFAFAVPTIVKAQCTLVDAACTGTALLASDGNKTIPSGTTYYVPSGTTYTGNITFTDATSKLCIEGTWTGKPAGCCPSGGTIDNYGTISNATAWSFSGGAFNFNNHIGGSVTINSFSTSGGIFTITNCWNMTFTAATGISSSGGTYTIYNYASINVNGTFGSTNGGFTFYNKPGSQLYVGNNFTFSDGSFINDANFCVTATSGFSGGTFTNNNCFRTTTYNISGSGAFTNNNYMTVVGNFTNSGTNNGNNGTMVVTGNYSGTGSFTLGPGSLLTCVDWSSSGTHTGPATDCAQIRATGTTVLSGTIAAGNSSRVYFYDSGLPAAGWDTKTGNSNSTNINDNTCSVTSYPACAMAGSACSSVLPIVLTEFKADCINNKIELVWTTASETNNDFFTIERAADAVNYEPVGIVDSKAPGGNSASTLNYSFTDNSFPKEESANNKMFYYRLKQTDFDGQFTYSFVSAATCSNYCIGDVNVVSDDNSIRLNIQSICSTFVDLSIYNALGQIVSTKRILVEAGTNDIQMDANAIAQGIYILKATTVNQSFQKKFGKK